MRLLQKCTLEFSIALSVKARAGAVLKKVLFFEVPLWNLIQYICNLVLDVEVGICKGKNVVAEFRGKRVSPVLSKTLV